MVTNEELALLLKKYSFGELFSSVEQITDGWVNLTYKFQTKSNRKFYILREYLPSSQRTIRLEDIQFELNFISYLFKQWNLPVAPMIDPPGIISLDNEHYCAIFPFIDGIKYVNTPNEANRELWQTIEISRFLGRLHSIPKRSLSSDFDRRTINIVYTKYQLIHGCDQFKEDSPYLYKRIREILDEHTKTIPCIEDGLEQIKFQTNLEDKLPKGFLHLDLHDDNVLFDSNSKQIAAVLDFDDLSFGPFLLDIAMTLCFWCSDGSQLDSDFLRRFLSEYQTMRGMRLTEEEWNLLEVYCYMTIMDQILFTIRSRESGRNIDEMVNELLSPIEQIAHNQMLLKRIQ